MSAIRIIRQRLLTGAFLEVRNRATFLLPRIPNGTGDAFRVRFIENSRNLCTRFFFRFVVVNRGYRIEFRPVGRCVAILVFEKRDCHRQ